MRVAQILEELELVLNVLLARSVFGQRGLLEEQLRPPASMGQCGPGSVRRLVESGIVR